MSQDFYETPQGESILEAYERGRRDGLSLALDDPQQAEQELNEYRSYERDKPHLDAYIAEATETREKYAPLNDDDLPF